MNEVGLAIGVALGFLGMAVGILLIGLGILYVSVRWILEALAPRDTRRRRS